MLFVSSEYLGVYIFNSLLLLKGNHSEVELINCVAFFEWFRVDVFWDFNIIKQCWMLSQILYFRAVNFVQLIELKNKLKKKSILTLISLQYILLHWKNAIWCLSLHYFKYSLRKELTSFQSKLLTFLERVNNFLSFSPLMLIS